MELWDLYDKDRNLLGRTHVRGTPMKKGEYHLAVFVWVFNQAGQVLLMKRSPEKKKYPNLWALTGGAALAGETSLEAICRELREETGIQAEASEMCLQESYRRAGNNDICDIYFLRKDVPVEKLVFQAGETCDAKWATRGELEEMIDQGLLAKPDICRYYQLQSRLDGVLK